MTTQAQSLIGRGMGNLQVNVGIVKRPNLMVIVLTGAIIIFSYIVPMTYDESWTYLENSAHGYFYPLTHLVGAPHVLFCTMQAFLPHFLTYFHPHSLRIWNILIGFLTLSLLYKIIGKQWLLAAVALCSPLIFLYWVFARGYLVSTFLLILALFVRSQEDDPDKFWKSDILLAITAFSVPTFAYVLPLILLSDLSKRRFWQVVKSGLRISALVLLLFSPILLSMIQKRNDIFIPYEMPFGYLKKMLVDSSAFPPFISMTFAGIWMVILPLVWWQSEIRDKGKNAALTLASYMGGAICSYVAVCELFNDMHLAPAPFERNGAFIPLLMWLSFILTVQVFSQKWPKLKFLMILPAANLVFALIMIFMAPDRGLSIPQYAQNSPTPIDASLIHQLPAGAEIACARDAEPACRMHKWIMYKSGIHYANVEPNPVNVENTCLFGKVVPEGRFRVWVKYQDNSKWQLSCL